MKKLITLFVMSVMLIVSFSFGTTAVEESEIQVRAKSGVLMDVSTGQVLYSFNENEKLYPASVTKIMPLLLFMEAIDSGKIKLEDKVTTSPTAAGKGGSQIWLKEGETMTVDELLRATAIGSANDACTALGEHIAGSEVGFVKMMNDRARELGMVNTNFVNCSGLDDDTVEHLTTAYDIALMSRELLKHERIRTYTTVWMDSLRGGETELVNTNKLVRFYSGTTGLKTGTTSKAGHCLSASAERDGLHLIAVVMGAENSTDRFEGAKAMLDWGFANFETVTPQIDSSLIGEVEILRGTAESIKPIIKGIGPLTLKAGEKSRIETEISLSENVEAPIEKNQTLGTVTLKIDDKEIAKYNLVSDIYVEKTNLGHIIVRFLRSLAKSA